MNFITFVVILLISDQCIVKTQCAGSGDDRNYPGTPRPDEAYMKKEQKSAKDERVRISQDEEMSERNHSVEESSEARRKRTGKTKIEHYPRKGTGSTSRRMWTNEEYGRLLRMVYAHYDSRAQSEMRTVNWKPIVMSWYGQWDFQSKDQLRFKFRHLRGKMQEAVKNFNNGGIEWSQKLDDDLVMLYFATEAGDESTHKERIHEAWLKKHPEYYRVAPAYLLKRAETMLFSVLKFSLDNPQGRVRLRQHVDWRPEHDRFLRYLWEETPHITKKQKQRIFDVAVERYPAMKHLDANRIYERAKLINSESARIHEGTNFDEGTLPDTTHAQYHPFMDDHNFLSPCLGIYGHQVGMESTCSQSRPSHQLTLFHSRRQSPDTN